MNVVMEMLQFYGLPLLAASVLAVCLSLCGSQLAARSKSLQVLSISQAATLGVLLGVLVSLGLDIESHVLEILLPTTIGVIFCALSMYLLNKFIAKQGVAKNNSLTAAYVFLLACTFWVISYFPALEGHMAQAFFGDIVTLHGVQLWLCLVFALVYLAYFAFSWRKITNQSFEQAVLGTPNRATSWGLNFELLSVFLIVVSVYSLGVLFTLGLIFIPAVLLKSATKSVKPFYFLVGGLAAAACVSGFSLSYVWERFSTVPSIVIACTLLCLCTYTFTAYRRS